MQGRARSIVVNRGRLKLQPWAEGYLPSASAAEVFYKRFGQKSLFVIQSNIIYDIMASGH